MKLNIVPARTGFAWFRAGLRTFWRQPLALTGLFFMFIALITVASLIPYIGGVFALALLPAATLGLMAATREAASGKFPMPTILWSAFRAGRERARAMLQLGAFYAVGLLLVLGISALVDGGDFARVYLLGAPLTPELIQSEQFRTATWLGLGLYVPLSLMFWHAPALVHWHNVSPVKSLFFSIVVCLRNWSAMLVYALAWALFSLAGAFLLLLLTGMFNPGMLGVLMLPTSLLFASMFFSSIWFTFEGSFVADAPSEHAPPDTPSAA